MFRPTSTEWGRLRKLVFERDLTCRSCGRSLACSSCGGPLPGVGRTVDHIIPVALGGTNDPDNLQLLCLECNDRKTWEDRETITAFQAAMKAFREKEILSTEAS